MTTTETPVDPAKLPEVQAVLSDITSLESFAQSYQVTIPAQFEAGAEDLKRVKGAAARLEEERTKITSPLNASLKAVNSFFRKPAERLAEIERIIKQRLRSFDEEQERKRRLEQARLDAEADAERRRLQEIAARATERGQEGKAQKFEERAERIVAPTAQLATPKVTGLAKRDNWVFRVKDASKLPREFLMPDEKKMGQLVKAMKKDAEGLLGGTEAVEVYNDPIYASSRA